MTSTIITNNKTIQQIHVADLVKGSNDITSSSKLLFSVNISNKITQTKRLGRLQPQGSK